MYGWWLADRSLLEEAKGEVNFYRNLLGGGFHRGDLIFDIGANQGSKTARSTE